MKRDDWRVSKEKFGKYYWYEHKANQSLPKDPVVHEKCLVGERGEIWHRGGSTYSCSLILGKNEKIFSFDIKELKKRFRQIKGGVKEDRALELLNNPNLRFKR